jgi:hypothetical protein
MKNSGSLIRVLFCIGILLLLGYKGQAQERQAPIVRNLNGGTAVHYQNAFGVRLGNQFGLTGKKAIGNGDFLEGILSTHFDKKGIVGTLLYEWHRNAFEARNLYWFYGGGVHVGYYQYKNYYDSDKDPTQAGKDGNFVEAGVDAIIGLEYGFTATPISLCVDAKPFVNLVGGDTGGIDGALSIRYTF